MIQIVKPPNVIKPLIANLSNNKLSKYRKTKCQPWILPANLTNLCHWLFAFYPPINRSYESQRCFHIWYLNCHIWVNRYSFINLASSLWTIVDLGPPSFSIEMPNNPRRLIFWLKIQKLNPRSMQKSKFKPIASTNIRK